MEEVGNFAYVAFTSDHEGEHENLLVSERVLSPVFTGSRVTKRWTNPYFHRATLRSGVVSDGSYLLARPNVATYDQTFGQCAVLTRSSYDPIVLARAVELYCSRLRRAGVTASTVWSWEDVHNHMTKQTSAGYPFISPTKEVAWNLEFNLIQTYWDSAFAHCLPVFTGSQKEEMRSREKVEAGRLRLFCSGSLVDYAFAMRLYGDLLCQLVAVNMRVGFWPGARHQYGGWDELVRTLLCGREDATWYEADGSKFDMTQSYSVLCSTVLPVLRAFAPPGQESRVEACLHDIVVCVLRHRGGHAVFLDKNNKSGSAFTIHVNMILQGVMLEYAHLQSGELDFPTYALCGDDNLLCTTSTEDPFRVYPEFGIILKYVNKSKDVADVEFMSKGFKLVDGRYVPTVDAQKHLCSLECDPTTDVGLYLQACNSMIVESAFSPGVEDLVKVRDSVLIDMKSLRCPMTLDSQRSGLATVRTLVESRQMYDPIPQSAFRSTNMPPKKTTNQNERRRRAQQSARDKSRAAGSGNGARGRARPARGGAAASSRGSIPRGPALDSATSLFLRSQMDPWAGKGAKWPDQNESYSVPLQVFTRITVTPSAAGEDAVRIYPGVLNGRIYASPTFTAGVVTNWGTGTSVAAYANLAVDFAQYRVVSVGMRISYVGNDYNNSGQLTVRLQPTLVHGATESPVSQDQFTMKYKIVPYKRGMVVSPKNVGIEAQHYEGVTDTSAALPSWEAFTMFITGADGTTPQSCVIEMVHNLELLPIANGTMATLASAPAAYHPEALRAVSVRNTSIESSFR